MTTRMGGGVLCMTWSCVGEVCVRSRSVPPSRKKVSCASRAGWLGGKLRPPKLWKASSTSGPSATEKPIDKKMSITSSSVWRRGWTWPRGRRRPGSGTSTGSPASARAPRRGDAARLLGGRGGEPLAGQDRRLRLERGGDVRLHRVGEGTHRRSLLLRKLPQPAQDRAERSLATEVADTDRPQDARPPGRRDIRPRLLPEPCELRLQLVSSGH